MSCVFAFSTSICPLVCILTFEKDYYFFKRLQKKNLKAFNGILMLILPDMESFCMYLASFPHKIPSRYSGLFPRSKNTTVSKNCSLQNLLCVSLSCPLLDL